jgi:drug/metabolite transporter (DMT)-like permease
MINMKREVKGTIFAILAAIISGISIPLNKIFVVDIDPMVFTSIRLLLIGVVFLLISFLRHEHINKKINIKYLALIAIIGGAFAFLLFFTGLKLTTSGRAAFLQKTLPVYVVLFAFLFLKEKISRKHFYSILIMLIGTVVIYYSDIIPSQLWLNPFLGDLLVIGATVLWALENVIARKVMIKDESNIIVSFFRMFFGGIILFALALFLGKYDALISLNSQQIINVSVSTIILFGYVFFWYLSLKLINASKASSLLLIAPVISLLLGILILKEPFSSIQLIGSALILIGAYFVSNIKSELQNI